MLSGKVRELSGENIIFEKSGKFRGILPQKTCRNPALIVTFWEFHALIRFLFHVFVYVCFIIMCKRSWLAIVFECMLNISSSII